MVEWLKQPAYALSLRLKSRARLEAENLVLRQQVNVLIRKLPKRLRLTNSDRLLLVWLYRLFPPILSGLPWRDGGHYPSRPPSSKPSRMSGTRLTIRESELAVRSASSLEQRGFEPVVSSD